METTIPLITVQSEDDANAVNENLKTMMASIERLNNTKVVFKITLRKKCSSAS